MAAWVWEAQIQNGAAMSGQLTAFPALPAPVSCPKQQAEIGSSSTSHASASSPPWWPPAWHACPMHPTPESEGLWKDPIQITCSPDKHIRGSPSKRVVQLAGTGTEDVTGSFTLTLLNSVPPPNTCIQHNWMSWSRQNGSVPGLSSVSVSHSVVSNSGTTWTAARQTPLSMGFSIQEYWSSLPFPSLGDLPNPGIEPGLPRCKQIPYFLNRQGSPMDMNESEQTPGDSDGQESWCAAVHRVAKSRTQLSNWTTTNRYLNYLLI